MNKHNPYGVINEQGYPAGQFGFSTINEEEKKNIDKKDNDENKKENE